MKTAWQKLFLLAFISSPCFAQLTSVTAQVKDVNNTPYANCTYEVDFVPNPAQTAPYTYGGSISWTKNYPNGHCDSFGNLSINLPDTLNAISPNDGQWKFTISSAPGYLAGPYVFQDTLVITGASQNLTSTFQTIAPILPLPGGISLSINGTTASSQKVLNFENGTNATITDLGGGNIQWSATGGGGGGGSPGVPLNSLQGNNASAFAGIPNTSANFSTGRLDLNNLTGIRYVTPAYNWSQAPGTSLTGGSLATVTLTPCPLGVSGSDANLYIYLTGGTGTAEPVIVTGGSCTPSAASGTVQFTPVNSHTGAWTINSASSGIYEALKDATPTNVNNAHLVLGATNPPASVFYSVYAPINVGGGSIDIDGGKAATIDCNAKTTCFKAAGNTLMHLHGFRVSVHTNYPGAAITNTACASNVSTITTTLNPSVGEYVDVQATFNKHYWGPHVVATTSGSSWTYTDTNCGGATTIAADNSTGGNAYLNSFTMVGFGASNAGNVVDHITVDSPGGFQTNTLNNLIVVGNDQAFHAHDIVFNSGLSGCTANYCANMIYAPGPFGSNAAVLYLDHLAASLFCSGNGITAYNGNTVSVSDAVIQGFNEWAISGGTATGGFGGFTLSNVYNEVGACSNPLYPGSGLQVRAEAGMMLQGGSATIRGGEFPIGNIPKFAATGNNGTGYNYWIVVKDSTKGTSAPMIAGYATVDSVTPTGSIVVSWPRVQGTATVTYDVLRNTGTGNSLVAPYNGGCAGGSTTACGSVATAQAQCGTFLCSFTDTASNSTSSYTVTNQNYYPFLGFWPGGMVVGNSSDSQTDSSTVVVNTDNLSFITNISPIVSVFGTAVPSVMAPRCDTGVSGVWISCLAGNSVGGSNAGVGGILLQNGPTNSGAATPNIKGRINFINNPGIGVNTFHLLTLVDSNPGKTLNTPFGRPANDTNDTFIGLDQGSAATASAQMSLGAPIAISSYIGNVGDNLNWKERLTSTLKTLAVPLTVSSTGAALIKPATTVVASLPSAAVNSNTISTVSDSTAIATEGQTCVGGGSTVALAFSNGSVWSCFSNKAGGPSAGLSGTGACATITTQAGGSFSGQATCTGTTGASTLIITPGTTASNGWVCYVQDQTTRANLLQQTANNATTCTLTATSITQNDVFVFTATPF